MTIAVDIEPNLRPNKTYPAGETCAASQCTTILSIYNPTVWCSRCEGRETVKWQERGLGSIRLRRSVGRG